LDIIILNSMHKGFF